MILKITPLESAFEAAPIHCITAQLVLNKIRALKESRRSGNVEERKHRSAWLSPSITGTGTLPERRARQDRARLPSSMRTVLLRNYQK